MVKKINQISSMPQMSVAFSGWNSNITLKVITQTVDSSGYVSNAERDITFKGVIQPLEPKKIALKEEGQRAFTWLQIHCLKRELNLSTNDRIVYDSKKYKVMAVNDYSLNNFVEYHVIEDYQA